MRKIQFFYLLDSLTSKEEHVAIEAVEEFARLVAPLALDMQFAIEPAHEYYWELMREVDSCVSETVFQMRLYSLCGCGEPTKPKLVYIGRPDRYIVQKWVSQEFPWSFSFGPGGGQAYCYKTPVDRLIIWREMLHLLGANYCYQKGNEYGPLTCGNERCLMQFDPDCDLICRVCAAEVRKYCRDEG